MRVNSLVIAWFLVTGCSGARPDYFYPYGFGDVCTTDSDCVQDYHCSAPQGEVHVVLRVRYRWVASGVRPVPRALRRRARDRGMSRVL